MKFNPDEIRRFVSVSTKYISQSDSESLHALAALHDSSLIVFEYEEGYWVLFSSDEESFKESIEKLELNGTMSKEFLDILRLAHDENIDYIQFDRDGGEHNGLPEFDW